MITKLLPIEPPKAPKISIIYRAIRRTHRVYILNFISEQLSRIFRKYKRIIIDRAIALHVIREL